MVVVEVNRPQTGGTFMGTFTQGHGIMVCHFIALFLAFLLAERFRLLLSWLSTLSTFEPGVQ
jgi:hypothetical protein